ncbi:MAG: phosphoribosylamine--glycine ligase [Candidatus Eisenbacteria bacterium]|nr:phosphoribosylamine--glycine ligase [Candidatus Eisenbacteria bacterium]
MRLLVLGAGGREHALAWACGRAEGAVELYGLPGNPGIAEIGMCLPGRADAPDDVLAAVREREIDLVLVGPEAPLVAGLADRLREAGVRVFGPSADAAGLEGSKVFAKELMRRHGVPTADFEVVEDIAHARRKLEEIDYPHVLKADGLAGGKGALIVKDADQARAAIELLMVEKKFGAAGERIVFEAFLEGEEMSVFAIASGESYRLLTAAQDYKRAHEGDRGPNTGGMGSIAPVVTWSEALEQRVRREIIEPTLSGMAREGRPYHGLLYAGLMVAEGAPRVVEFNCRFGDPETQALVPLLSDDLLGTLWAASEPQRAPAELPAVTYEGRYGACVVIASGGYPEGVRKGFPIRGLAQARALPDTLVFQAGTVRRDEQLITAGGRVLNVVGMGDTLPDAVDRAYAAAERIEFSGAFYRRDIGWRGLQALERGAANAAGRPESQ